MFRAERYKADPVWQVAGETVPESAASFIDPGNAEQETVCCSSRQAENYIQAQAENL